MKKVYTTGQVAKMCGVAPRTSAMWFDTGRLKGYRIPGSKARRIPREHLIRFLKEYGMPLGELAGKGAYRVLTVGLTADAAGRLAAMLPACEVKAATGGPQAGMVCVEFRPDAIVIDFAVGRADADAFVSALRQSPWTTPDTVVFGLAGEDTATGETGEYTAVFPAPADLSVIASRLKPLAECRGDDIRLTNDQTAEFGRPTGGGREC